MDRVGPDVLLAPAPWPVELGALLAAAFVASRGSAAPSRQRRAEIAADALLATHVAALALRSAAHKPGGARKALAVRTLVDELEACAWRTLCDAVHAAASAYVASVRRWVSEGSDGSEQAEQAEQVAYAALLRVLERELKRHR